MDVKKSLIVIGTSSLLLAGFADLAIAKKTEDEDSVYRWGRWAVLAPAAGNEEVLVFAPPVANDLGRCESKANCPQPVASGEPVEPPPPPPPPQPELQSPCGAGLPCGLARVDSPYRGQVTPPDSSRIAPFALSMGTGEGGGMAAFVVDPDTTDEIASGDLPAVLLPSVVMALPGTDSILVGEITPDEEDQPVVVRGVWGVGEAGGEFVWGVTATAEQMLSLIDGLGSDKIATYEGWTQGITNGAEGSVSMSVNFSNSTWSGQFNNNAFSVQDGVVVDSGFVTGPDSKFSTNIASGKVYGAFVNSGNNAIGAYDVTDKSGIHSADVFKADLTSQLD